MTRKLLFEPLPRSPATSRSFPHLCFLMTPRPERAFYAGPGARGRRPVGSGEGARPRMDTVCRGQRVRPD